MSQQIPNLSRPRVNAADGLLMRSPESLYADERLRPQHAIEMFNAYFEGWAHGKALAMAVAASCGIRTKSVQLDTDAVALQAFGIVTHDRVIAPDNRATSLRYRMKSLQREAENLKLFYAEHNA